MRQLLHAGYQDAWLPFLILGAPSGPYVMPTPALYGPLSISLDAGGTQFSIGTDEANVPIYMQLAAAGTSTLDLTGAMLQFLVRQSGSSTTLFTGSAVMVTTVMVGYVFTAANIALMAPGSYTAAVLVSFPSGEVREFGVINITVHAPAI